MDATSALFARIADEAVAGPLPCSRCGAPRDRKASWCRECRNAHARERRRAQPPTDEQRRRDIARSYAGVYLRRGKLTRQPCEVCGDEHSQMHHPDYEKPLEVRWLCRSCHAEEHGVRPSDTSRPVLPVRIVPRG